MSISKRMDFYNVLGHQWKGGGNVNTRLINFLEINVGVLFVVWSIQESFVTFFLTKK